MIKEKANMLLEKEILTEKGIQKLISYLKGNPNKQNSEILIILEFLVLAFHFELISRSQNGRKIEEQIKQEDEPKTFYWAMPLPGTRISNQMIHPKRSTMGLTRTLHELKDIGLMREFTFVEAQAKLEDFTIVAEGGLIALVLEREQYYEDLKN